MRLVTRYILNPSILTSILVSNSYSRIPNLRESRPRIASRKPEPAARGARRDHYESTREQRCCCALLGRARQRGAAGSRRIQVTARPDSADLRQRRPGLGERRDCDGTALSV